MNVYKNLKRKEQIEHQFYLQSKKSVPVLAKAMGMDYGYFASTTYGLKCKFRDDDKIRFEAQRIVMRIY